jgi:hypothetical protein
MASTAMLQSGFHGGLGADWFPESLASGTYIGDQSAKQKLPIFAEN